MPNSGYPKEAKVIGTLCLFCCLNITKKSTLVRFPLTRRIHTLLRATMISEFPPAHLIQGGSENADKGHNLRRPPSEA